jgi:hypothetical protein
MLREALAMLYLVFGLTAEEPALRIGPVASFKLRGGDIVDDAGTVVSRHNGHRWTVKERSFYRVDCEGPVRVGLEGARRSDGSEGPFDHFSLFNGTAYASRDVFAHYNEHDGAWHLHKTHEQCLALHISPA